MENQPYTNQPATSQPQPGQPNENPSPNEDQNLGGNDAEVNPGEVGQNTEVDLDKTQINTYEGDGSTKH